MATNKKITGTTYSAQPKASFSTWLATDPNGPARFARLKVNRIAKTTKNTATTPLRVSLLRFNCGRLKFAKSYWFSFRRLAISIYFSPSGGDVAKRQRGPIKIVLFLVSLFSHKVSLFYHNR